MMARSMASLRRLSCEHALAPPPAADATLCGDLAEQRGRVARSVDPDSLADHHGAAVARRCVSDVAAGAAPRGAAPEPNVRLALTLGEREVDAALGLRL